MLDVYNTNNFKDDDHIMAFDSYSNFNTVELIALYDKNKQIANNGCRSLNYKECSFQIEN